MVMETVIVDPELNEHHHLNSNGQSQQHSNLEELCSLLRNEVPESRQTLLDTQSNLEKVADYCSTAYLEADDKRLAFENTKNYTTHSLASVAYQINTLAFNVLHMLDLQTNQISEMESQMNYISQKFQFHNEKVARRKIALLTSAKAMVRQPKVLMPANQEKQSKYIRKPIDFSLLDDIGHGVKISNQSSFLRSLTTANTSGRMSGVQTLGPKSSMSSLSHYHHYNTLSGSGPAPTTKPPTPPQAIRSGFGTLSRSAQNKEYRALVPPIAPPQVPKNYESNYPIGHPKSSIIHRQSSTTGSIGSGNSGYAPGHHQSNHQNNNNNPQQQQQYMAGYSIYHPGSSAVSLNSNMYGVHTANSQQVNTNLDDNNSSPPLPPPPPTVDNVHGEHSSMNKQQQIYGLTSARQNVPDWVPANYIEKVIAIYDYSADKDDELTFQENSVIYVTSKNDDGWFEGIMNGAIGLFPGNYPNTNDSNISGSGGGGGGGSDSDQDFDPSAEMLVNDFDDEHTMDEEEALADDDDEIDDELTNKDEIEKLNQEKDIPIEELLRMYGYDKPTTTTTSDNVDQSTSDSSNSNNLTSQTQTSVTTAATTAVNNNINQLLSDSSDDDSDEDFSVNEDEWRRTIQVGSDFQAVIPDGLKHYEHDSIIGHNNILLWKPPISLLNLDEYLLEYAKLSLSSDEDSLNDFVLPTGAHIKDDEQALFTLFQCKYDMKKALYLHENDNETKAPISEPMTPWSEEECRAFESGLRALGKDFYQIKHSRIPTRSVGEVVSFYYLWKKTERHDIFANKFRIEKKKYSLHPGTTDYMDRFLDEQEN
ncbi:Abl interactor 2, partial [Dermatophagoides pteronyssinus]